MTALPNNLGPQSVGLVPGEPERSLSGDGLCSAGADYAAATHSRDGSGNQFDVLQSYWRDPRELDAETSANRRRVQYEMDRFAIDNFKGDDEPGWITVFRERVAAYEMGVGRG